MNFHIMENFFSHYRDQLHDNTVALNLAFQNIQNITLIQNSIINNIKLNELLSLSNTVLLILDSNVNDIIFVKAKVEQTLEAALSHKTSSALYTYTFLQPILQETTTELRAEPIFPISIDHFHKILFYSWTTVEINTYTIITIFPFTNTDIFHTLHVIPLPVKINDSISNINRIKLIPSA